MTFRVSDALADGLVVEDPIYGCYLWQGRTDRNGYPIKWIGPGRKILVYRAVYERERGPIPDDRFLDHLCRRRECVRPEHLEAVTRSENERRKSWRRRIKIKACPRGHDLYTSGRRTPEGGYSCLVCCGMK